MNITFGRGRFIAHAGFEDRHALRRAGFTFEKADGVFTTPSRTAAARLRAYCDSAAKNEIDRTLIRYAPYVGPLPTPRGDRDGKALQLMPHQVEMARFSLSRNRSYLAADPGTGKTPTAVTIANALRAFVVYICPPFLALNVLEEFNRWSMRRLVRIYGRDSNFSDTLLVPDSRLGRPDLLPLLEWMRNNARAYDLPFVLFVDEAHRFNGPNAIRSMALYEDIIPLFDRVVHMSGTPMNNRPMDLYNVLSNCAPETIKFMDRFEFGRRYCAGKRNRFGWDFKGASNVRELAAAIRPKYMLRVRADVLSLPPLRQEFVFIGADVPAKVAPLEAAVLREYSPTDLLAPTMSAHVSTYRKELGALKVAPAMPFLTDLVRHTDEAFILGCVHRDVIGRIRILLSKYLPLAARDGFDVIDGSVAPAKRLPIAKAFQAGRLRCLVMNLEAGGIGFNLTRASRVLLLEYSWVPSVNRQFICRAVRIGQRRSVLAQYFVFRNSLDRKVLEAGFRKEALISSL
jgi:SWI/SNF-related matrix-associated actin-dependent regulator of chromatin subfamily A-like protein 1